MERNAGKSRNFACRFPEISLHLCAMVHDKTAIVHLAQLMQSRGIRHVVISPGSRNAPLISVFCGNAAFSTYTVVDERSAAFFALGMAQQLGRAVALVCTSGSAMLNYAPAVAEAFWQRLPLVLLTADRPPEWIGQGDGQTIYQQNAFGPHVQKSVNLPSNLRSSDDIWYNNRLINEALNAACSPVPGPVHINIPLTEPLYGFPIEKSENVRVIHEPAVKTSLSFRQQAELKDIWNQSSKKMILAGQMKPDALLQQILQKFAARADVVVLTETTSNLFSPLFIGSIDRTLAAIRDTTNCQPDLLLTIGGAVVSKQIKSFLRKAAPKYHWNCDAADPHTDTYQCLSHAIRVEPAELFGYLAGEPEKPTGYASLWEKCNLLAGEKHRKFLENTAWSDLKIFETLIGNMPQGFDVQLANSTPVRYAQLFDEPWAARFDSNRGTSGIDGSLSTAAGAALASQRPTLLISGDLAFFYDSNGLWNRHLPANLKIVVIHNQGGGIFRFIEGPDQTPHLGEYFQARHQTSAVALAKVFDVACFEAHSEAGLLEILPAFFAKNTRAALLELHSPAEESGKTIREYFRFLRA